MTTTTNRILLGTFLIAGGIWAQDNPRGHWTGNIDIPDRTLAVEIDLDKTANGWVGSISIPAQNASGLPLEAISFANGKCSFRIKGVPGDPTFSGALSGGGKTLSGEFTQGPGAFPFKLTRTGDPKIEEPKKSPPLAAQFLGTWEGTLEAGQPLRLILKMANAEGGASGVLISVDQAGAQIPVTTIEQKETRLVLVLKLIAGEYRAEISADGTVLNGTWTQAGNSLPLKLKKSGSSAK